MSLKSSLQGRELERGVESNKADLEAKTVSEAARQQRSEAAKCNILISPLEGEKKFLSKFCELRNFREGYKKYKTLDRATECAMTASAVHILLLDKYAKPTFETGYSPLTNEKVFSRFTSHFSRKRIARRAG